MAKISVIIPAYNSELFIAETFESLINQTLKDIEVVVVNDGSVDNTQKIIDEYCEKYPFFKSVTQENAGVSAARNNGLEKATGEYVVFLDADDYYDSTSLEGFYEAAKKENADIVIGRLRTFNENEVGKFNEYADKLSKMKTIDTKEKMLLWNFLVSNKCYQRERLVKSGVRFPKYKYSEEGAFFMRYVFTGAKITGTENSVMYYRRHTAKQGLSVSQTVSCDLAKSFSASLEMIYSDAKNAGFDEEYLQEILYKNAFVLLSQFYRLMWHGDDECVEYCAKEFNRLKTLMSEKTLSRIKEANTDLHLENIAKSKEEAAQRPNLSVIVKKDKKNMSAFLINLFDQISPLYEVIVPESAVKENLIPQEILSCKNLVTVPDKHFLKNAKKAAKSKRRVVFFPSVRLDIRTFRMIYRIPISENIKTAFFSFMIKSINFILVKGIVK